jgi:branched-chain amino acid transport system ATP-binding protein
VLLEVQNLRVHYEKVEAVKGISFRLEDEDFICLIGANGAGKTTTLRTLSGLKRPTMGEILFREMDISRLSPVQIAQIGIIHVPEGRRIFSYLSVHENLLVGAYLIRDKKRITKSLETVFQHFPRLAERKTQQGGSLSGGEQQMLAFGRALMAGPKLLLLDEPTLGLSPLMVQECSRFACAVNREGMAMILVEQNARLALAISKRAYVMETGTIVLEGPSSELVRSEHVRKAYLGA